MMASKTILLDDMEEQETLADAGRISFALEGQAYEIDLCGKNATKLRGQFAEWVANARPVGRRVMPKGTQKPTGASRNGSTRASGYTKEQLTEARRWLNEHGHPVSDFGQIPGADLAYYEANAGRPVA